MLNNFIVNKVRKSVGNNKPKPRDRYPPAPKPAGKKGVAPATKLRYGVPVK